MYAHSIANNPAQ